jgi:hypothetical protein
LEIEKCLDWLQNVIERFPIDEESDFFARISIVNALKSTFKQDGGLNLVAPYSTKIYKLINRLEHLPDLMLTGLVHDLSTWIQNAGNSKTFDCTRESTCFFVESLLRCEMPDASKCSAVTLFIQQQIKDSATSAIIVSHILNTLNMLVTMLSGNHLAISLKGSLLTVVELTALELKLCFFLKTMLSTYKGRLSSYFFKLLTQKSNIKFKLSKVWKF